MLDKKGFEIEISLYYKMLLYILNYNTSKALSLFNAFLRVKSNLKKLS